MKSIQSFINFPGQCKRKAQRAENLLFSLLPINIPNNHSLYFICILMCVSFSLSMLLSVRGEGEVKKNSNILCDRNCKLCCWDMKLQVLTDYHTVTDMPWCIAGQVNSFYPTALQVTQETENLMIQQITGLTAQQAPPIPIKTQEIMELQARVNKTSEKALLMEGAKNTPTEEPNKKVAKDYDTDSTDRYLRYFHSSLLLIINLYGHKIFSSILQKSILPLINQPKPH